MENKVTNTDYQKFVKVRDQKWETQICNPSQFFCLRFVFTIFYTDSFQVPLEKNHRHLKCQFSPKILTWPKSILYKDSEKWLISLPPKLCPSTTSFLKAHHTTSLGTQSKAFSKSTDTKYKFFFFCKILPLQLFQDKNGVCGSAFWHKSKLHLINVPLLSYQLINNSLSYIQNPICSFKSPIIPPFLRITFPITTIYRGAKSPFCWNNFFYYYLIY